MKLGCIYFEYFIVDLMFDFVRPTPPRYVRLFWWGLLRCKGMGKLHIGKKGFFEKNDFRDEKSNLIFSISIFFHNLGFRCLDVLVIRFWYPSSATAQFTLTKTTPHDRHQCVLKEVCGRDAPYILAKQHLAGKW